MTGDIDDVKHQIALILASASFLAVLAAIDTEKNAAQEVSIATPGPAEIKEYEIANPQLFPHCQIIGGASEFDQESTAQEAGHEVQIVWLHVADDEGTVAKVIERLVRATRVLWGTTFEGACNAAPLRVIREDYSDLTPTPTNAFLKGGRTFVLVPTVVQ